MYKSITNPSHKWSLNDLNTWYSYLRLRRGFPWVRRFRAGVILLYDPPCIQHAPNSYQSNKTDDISHSMICPEGASSMLLVKQRPQPPVTRGHWGPPKGSADGMENASLATALRELREETGIVPDSTYRIVPRPIIYARWYGNIREVIVYYIIITSTQPKVEIDKVELSNYRWVRMGDIPNMHITEPTRALVQELLAVGLPRYDDASMVSL